MNSITIKIQGKPVSINKAHYRNKTLTVLARQYREIVWKELTLMKNEVQQFRNNFNKEKHGLEVSVTVFTPVKKYYLQGNKNLGVSSMKFDLGNLLKLLDDFVLNERYAEKGAPVVGIDDRWILQYKDLRAVPHNSDQWVVEYSLTIINTPEILPTHT